jgi:hypothetical protein
MFMSTCKLVTRPIKQGARRPLQTMGDAWKPPSKLSTPTHTVPWIAGLVSVATISGWLVWFPYSVWHTLVSLRHEYASSLVGSGGGGGGVVVVETFIMGTLLLGFFVLSVLLGALAGHYVNRYVVNRRQWCTPWIMIGVWCAWCAVCQCVGAVVAEQWPPGPESISTAAKMIVLSGTIISGTLAVSIAALVHL